MADEPSRLRDDPSAPAVVRDDLRRVEQFAPAAFDVNLGLERLRAKLSPASTTAIGAGHVALWSAGVLVVATVTALVLWSTSPTHAPLPARPASVTTTPREVRAAEPVTSANPSTLNGDAGVRSPLPVRRPNASDPDARLRRELAHLAKLRSIAGRHPARALRVADEGQRAFRGGMFEEEREAIAVFSLAALERDAAARSRARIFLARYPRGPFAERVRAIADDREGAPQPATSRNGGSR